MRRAYLHAKACIQKPEESFWESIFPFYHLGVWIKLWSLVSIKLSGRRLYKLLSTGILLMWWITIYSLNFICIYVYVISSTVPIIHPFFFRVFQDVARVVLEWNLVCSKSVTFWTKDFVSWTEGNEVLQSLIADNTPAFWNFITLSKYLHSIKTES